MANLQSQSDAWLVLKEAWLRLQEKSPKFFRVIKVLNALLVAVGGILTSINEFGITLPAVWMAVVSKYIIALGIWGYIMSNLAVTKPTEEVMPFTEKKNIEKAIKENAAAEN